MPFADQMGAQFGEFAFPKWGKRRNNSSLVTTETASPRNSSCSLSPDLTPVFRRLQGFQFTGLGTVGQRLLQKFRALEVISQGLSSAAISLTFMQIRRLASLSANVCMPRRGCR